MGHRTRRGHPVARRRPAKPRDICLEIQTKKDTYRLGALERARSSLTELAEQDPAGLPRLLTEFDFKAPK